MNKFIKAIKSLPLIALKELLIKEPQWIHWAEYSGKNGLHRGMVLKKWGRCELRRPRRKYGAVVRSKKKI